MRTYLLPEQRNYLDSIGVPQVYFDKQKEIKMQNSLVYAKKNMIYEEEIDNSPTRSLKQRRKKSNWTVAGMQWLKSLFMCIAILVLPINLWGQETTNSSPSERVKAGHHKHVDTMLNQNQKKMASIPLEVKKKQEDFAKQLEDFFKQSNAKQEKVFDLLYSQEKQNELKLAKEPTFSKTTSYILIASALVFIILLFTERIVEYRLLQTKQLHQDILGYQAKIEERLCYQEQMHSNKKVQEITLEKQGSSQMKTSPENKKYNNTKNREKKQKINNPKTTLSKAQKNEKSDHQKNLHFKKTGVVITPGAILERIVQQCKKYPYINALPKLPEGVWNMGFSSIKGHVRKQQQDYAMCFQMGNIQVAMVADGCGGIPKGELASYFAVAAAVRSIIKSYATILNFCPNNLQTIAAIAVRDACHQLACEAIKLGIKDPHSSLRTTLIVVLANKEKYGYAYVGDGGGFILRTCDECELESFLTPQNHNGDPGILAASLGPILEGEAIIGEVIRKQGDLLLIGSDGVFTKVHDTFAIEVLRHAIEKKGNLQHAVTDILHSLADSRDDGMYVFDDNLSLAVMTNMTAPKLCQNFWKKNYLKEEME